MEKPTLYMETTIPSYLLAEPSRDVLVLARQDITRTWWKRDQARYAIFVSAAVPKICTPEELFYEGRGLH
jgi:hypothetical protein